MAADEIPQIKPKTEEKQASLMPNKGEKQASLMPNKGETQVMAKLGKLKIKIGKRGKKIILATGIALLVFLLAIVIPSILVLGKARAFYASAQGIIAATQAQNLPQVKEEIGKTKNSLSSLQKTFGLLSWTTIGRRLWRRSTKRLAPDVRPSV